MWHRPIILSSQQIVTTTTSGPRHSLPLIQGVNHRSGKLTYRLFRRNKALDMVKRRAIAAGFPKRICCHTCLATAITAFLEVGGTKAQAIAYPESPKATKLYDTSDQLLNEIERIRI
jgi:integrase/recombinase XerD